MPDPAGNDTNLLLRRALAGDEPALAALFDGYRDRLRKMIRLRLDRRLSGRVDLSDVLQDAYLDVRRRIAEYARDPAAMLFHLWLRLVAGQRLTDVHRHHLGAQMRDPRREVSIHGGAMPETTTTAIAAVLLGDLTGASEAAVRLELKARLQEALDAMDPLDREVLALRHFEQLSPGETARVLGIKESAAGKRYVRALRRLKGILEGLGGGWLEP